MSSRIAIVCEFGTRNGGENSMLAAIKALPDGEFEFVFLAPPEGLLADELRARGLRHVPLSLHDSEGNRLPRDEACRLLLQAVRDISPDLVHANSLAMGRLTGAIAAHIDVPCVAHLRDILRLSRAATADLNQNRLLICVSNATRDYHLAQGLQPWRMRVVYNGVDCEEFQPRPRAGWLRTELGLPDSAFLVATIGQIGLRKGQDILAETAGRIANTLPDVHYLLVGERYSQKQESVDFEESVIKTFQTAGIFHRLHRLGYRTDVAGLLREIDVLFHPARQEPFGRVLLEAAASGVPIVATDVGGTPEMLTHGNSALLFPPDAIGTFAMAIDRFYKFKGMRKRCADAARKTVQENFDIKSAAINLANVWRDVLAAQSGREFGSPPPTAGDG